MKEFFTLRPSRKRWKKFIVKREIKLVEYKNYLENNKEKKFNITVTI